jgi:hypothetical protein
MLPVISAYFHREIRQLADCLRRRAPFRPNA